MGSRNIWKRKSTGLVDGLDEETMSELMSRFLACTLDRQFTKIRNTKRKLRLEGRSWVCFKHIVEVLWTVEVKVSSKSLEHREEPGLGRGICEPAYIIKTWAWLKWSKKTVLGLIGERTWNKPSLDKLYQLTAYVEKNDPQRKKWSNEDGGEIRRVSCQRNWKEKIESLRIVWSTALNVTDRKR